MANQLIFRRDQKEDDTIVNILASALRRDISFGALRPDEKLKIHELRSRYGGSNHSMRETLRILTAEGLVEATSQRGFRVTSATEDDLSDIELVRVRIEQTALSLALESADVNWEGRVMAAHHALQKAEDALRADTGDLLALQWDEACRAFSAALTEGCGSPRLIEMQRRFFDQSRRFRLAMLREGRLDFEARKRRQKALLEAVLAREAERALDLLGEDIKADLRSET